MNKEQLNKSLEAMNPTQEQKDRMLNVLLKEMEQKDQVTTLKSPKAKSINQWRGLAASLVVVVGATMLWQNSKLPNQRVEAPPVVEAPTEYPTGIRKMMHFKGFRYAFLESETALKLEGQDIGAELGKVPKDATFAVGGTIYELKAYDSAFRVAVYLDNQYYIAENVANQDDSPINIETYFNQINLEKNVVKGELFSHMGFEELKVLEKEEIAILIDSLKKAHVVQLTPQQHEAIAQSQSEGLAYQIRFTFKDGTTLKHNIIPSINYVTVGDYTCKVDGLKETVSSIFVGIK